MLRQLVGISVFVWGCVCVCPARQMPSFVWGGNRGAIRQTWGRSVESARRRRRERARERKWRRKEGCAGGGQGCPEFYIIIIIKLWRVTRFEGRARGVSVCRDGLLVCVLTNGTKEASTQHGCCPSPARGGACQPGWGAGVSNSTKCGASPGRLLRWEFVKWVWCSPPPPHTPTPPFHCNSGVDFSYSSSSSRIHTPVLVGLGWGWAELRRACSAGNVWTLLQSFIPLILCGVFAFAFSIVPSSLFNTEILILHENEKPARPFVSGGILFHASLYLGKCSHSSFLLFYITYYSFIYFWYIFKLYLLYILFFFSLLYIFH